MSAQDGGAAFPIPNDNNRGTWDGMTLRDYFAAKAMQGALASGETENPQGGFDTTAIAEWAYSMADAMLAERERRS